MPSARSAPAADLGLKVYAQLDESIYERGITIPDAALAAVNLHPDPCYGERNHTIEPAT